MRLHPLLALAALFASSPAWAHLPMPAGSNPTTFHGGWIATATASGPAATASAAPASAAPADFWGEAVVAPPVEDAVSVEAPAAVEASVVDRSSLEAAQALEGRGS